MRVEWMHVVMVTIYVLTWAFIARMARRSDGDHVTRLH